MRNWVFGEEIEWTGGYRQGPEGTWLPIGGVADKIIKEVVARYEHCAETLGNSSVFLPNGARVYNETSGQHLETAPPECSSAREMVKYDKWCELFVCWAVKALKEKYDIDLVFYKKNADSRLGETPTASQNGTRGCHENYFAEKKFGNWLTSSDNALRSAVSSNITVSIDPEINYLILFLITRQIFTGAGGVMLYSLIGGEDLYEISPRTFFIDAIISPSSTNTGPAGRPIVHVRSESLSDDNTYFRNHLILGDANMADLSIFLKFGTTSAVMEMLESGFWDRRLCLRKISDAPHLLKAISRDLTVTGVPITLEKSGPFNPLQIQRKFLRNWQKYLKHTHQGGEKAEIAERWQEVLDRLGVDDEKLYSQLDWKIKMRLVRNFMDRKHLPLNHEKIVNLDKVYHSPDQELSFYYKLKNQPSAQFESLVTDDEVLEADRTPPENRAKLRVHLKRLFDELGLVSSVNWDFITFGSSEVSYADNKIRMIDPRLSSVLSLNLPINVESLKILNSLRPGAIVV